MPDVFISYSHRDHEAAMELIRVLEAEGWSCWMDTARIEIGAELAPILRSALVEVRCVVAMMTEFSVLSNWVRMETGIAAEAGKLIRVGLGSAPAEPDTHLLSRPFSECPGLESFLDEVESLVGVDRPKRAWDSVLEVTCQRYWRQRKPLIAKEWIPSDQEYHPSRVDFSFSDVPYRLFRRVTLEASGTHELDTTRASLWAMGVQGSVIALAVVYIDRPTVEIAVPRYRPLREYLTESGPIAYAAFTPRPSLLDYMSDVEPFRTLPDYTLVSLPPES